MDAMPHPKPEAREKHERGCKCRPCIGRRNRRAGATAQRRALKALAEAEGTVARFWSSFSNEETAGLRLFQVEVKKGKQVPQFVRRAFSQAERALAVGSGRKPLVLLEPDGTTETLALMKLHDLLELVRAVSALGEQT